MPASKVILGVPFFGIDWPTNNGTMAANAAGGANDIPDSQAAANGPEYWDPVTDTAWTSYQVGNQWHESYYEGLNGLFDISQLAAHYNARGVGIWALGMENNDAPDDRGARRHSTRAHHPAPAHRPRRPHRRPALRRPHRARRPAGPTAVASAPATAATARRPVRVGKPAAGPDYDDDHRGAVHQRASAPARPSP